VNTAKVWKRTWVGGSIAGALALLLSLTAQPSGPALTLAIGALLAAGCILEVQRMGEVGRRLVPLGAVLPLLIVVGMLTARALDGGLDPGSLRPPVVRVAALPITLALLVALLTIAVVKQRTRGADARPPLTFGPALIVAWVVFPLTSICLLRAGYGNGALVALLLLSKVGDVAGYYVGSAIGKTRPFPQLSPGKTTAGCVGSLIAGALAGLACQAGGLLPDGRWGLLTGLVAGALLNLAAQAGDLAESLLKRRTGVKDSGTWFGPSGGVLDVVDSVLLTVPVALATWPLLYPLSSAAG